MLTTLVQPVFIAVLVVLEVAVWQLRVALATRGRKRSAALLGAVNAVLSVLALGQVVTHLDRPGNVAGYALGVVIGVYLGFSPTTGSPPIRSSTAWSCPATVPPWPTTSGPGAGQ
jgi:uncharacterized protein YebE (UPF0316 family)